MPKYPYRSIGSFFDRVFRNNLNDNFKDIEADVKYIDGRVDNLVSNAGNSNTEIVDARQGDGVTHPTLRDHTDAIHDKIGIVSANAVRVESFPIISPEANDTARIQRALDSMTTGVLIFASKPYTRGKIVVSNKTDFQMIGYGSIHNLTGYEASIELQGSLDNVTIEGFTVQGNAVVADRHKGIASINGTTLKNVKIFKNKIKDVVIGISLNSDTSGTIEGGIVQDNHIENVVGINTGEGYGIHVTYHDLTKTAGMVISKNTIINAYRHSIYVARGKGYIVKDNTIKDHRKNASDQSNPRAAIEISRSQEVVIDGNFIENAYTAGIMITPDTIGTGYPTKNIIVTHNVVKIATLYAIYVGYLTPSGRESLDYVTIENNIVSGPVILYYGKYVSVKSNIIDGGTGFAMFLNAEEDGTGTATYSKKWLIANNLIAGNKAFRLNNFAKSIIDCLIKDNQLNVTTASFESAYVVTNPNITVEGQGTDGTTISLKASILSNGKTGTFTTTDGKTITITNGVVTGIA